MVAQRKPMVMASILDNCAGARRQEFAAGTILLSEGETSGRRYVLAEGTVEVLRGDTQVAIIRGAGSIFGEMSVLLNRPHTATVRAASPVGAFVFESRRPQAPIRRSRQPSRHGGRDTRDADSPAARGIHVWPGGVRATPGFDIARKF